MSSNENPFASEEITPAINDEWVAKRRVAETIKQLTEALVTSSPSIGEMHDIANKLEAAAADFSNSPRIYGRRSWAETGEHGGYVAAIFDQFLGTAQQLGGQPGMTGYLNTSYHNRTPLNTELRLEGILVKVDGRKTILRAEMFAEGVMTASCEGLFVQPRGGLHAMKVLDAARKSKTDGAP